MFAVVYGVCVCDDQAFHSLTENVFKLDCIISVRRYYVLENAPGTHRRQLTRIAYKNQSCRRSYCPQKRLHKVNIYHRRLVHHDYILIERVVLATTEYRLVLRRPLRFKQTMNGFRFPARRLRHPFCGTTRRSAQRNGESERFKYSYYRPSDCRFTRSGTPRQHKYSLTERIRYRLFLQLCI